MEVSGLFGRNQILSLVTMAIDSARLGAAVGGQAGQPLMASAADLGRQLMRNYLYFIPCFPCRNCLFGGQDRCSILSAESLMSDLAQN